MNDKELNLYRMEMFRDFLQLKQEILLFITPIVQKQGLTPVGAVILGTLEQMGESTVGVLARKMEINQGNLSSMCKKLEKSGFLERRRKQEDERVVLLRLTEKGEEALFAVGKQIQEYDEIVMRKVPENLEKVKEGIEAFYELLKFVNHMNVESEREGGQEKEC